VGDATVAEILAGSADGSRAAGSRVGITGPPGAGKSSLIAHLVPLRLRRARCVGVLAIDPSSPISDGSLLGDRIRLGEGGSDERLFFRSMPSRWAHDGLTDNVAELLSTMERHGVDEAIVETVGVGQVDYTVRCVVDTVVLVLVPGAGDEVQSLKAGILEMADIIVVNKGDLPGAEKLHTDLTSMVATQRRAPGEWRPPVLLVSALKGDLAQVSDAIDEHAALLTQRSGPRMLLSMRTRYRVASLLARRIEEVLRECEPSTFDGELDEVYRRVLREL
jgi:LAO/AO transport system kinase